MQKAVSANLLKGEAYRLYYREFGERLDYLSEQLSGGIDPAGREELKVRFHMLKGGAGFFGFEEIYRVASELESIFSKAGEISDPDFAEITQRRDLLQEHQKLMPQPLVKS